MLRYRSLLPFLAVMLLALLVAACGGESGSSDDDDAARDAKADSSRSEPEIEAGSAEALDAKTGSATFVVTPELAGCMGNAGFAQDPTPVPGGIVSWQHHRGGAKVVVTPSSEVAMSVAGEIGTAEAPANVHEARVTAGPVPLLSAAAACLDA